MIDVISERARWEEAGLDKFEAATQVADERSRLIKRAKASGATYVQIAKSLGVSKGRVHQIAIREEPRAPLIRWTENFPIGEMIVAIQGR